MSSLQLDGVSRVVEGESWLAGVNLTLESGPFHTLVGPIRAGKTTLLRQMAGLDRPTSGRVFWNGRDVTGVNVRHRNASFVYERFVNYPSMTVFENVASPLRAARRYSADEIDGRVRAAAERLELSELLDRLPEHLSGGQQQRTALARALVKDADLVLLDQPLANLDYKLRELLREDLKSAFADRDSVVVYATPDPVEALIFGGTATVLHEGRILQHGSAREVYRRPASTAAARILSEPPMNLVPAAALPALAPPDAPADATLGIRPHDLRLEPAAELTRVPVTVLLSEVSGSATRLHCRFGDATDLVAQVEGIHLQELNAERPLHVAADRVFLFDPAGQLLRAPEYADG